MDSSDTPIHGYVIDAESTAEMTRLLTQDRLITRHIGLLPHGFGTLTARTVLDVACGPGGWILEMADAYPAIKFTGVDLSEQMIQYARTQAQTRQLDNVTFQVMDVLQPLDFVDTSFELVNARFLVGFMPRTAWPGLVQECKRILRPGGTLILTESDNASFVNCAATLQFAQMLIKAFWAGGHGFADQGTSTGMTAALTNVLREAGFLPVNYQAAAIDFSFLAEDTHPRVTKDFLSGYRLIKPFLIKQGVFTEEEFEMLYHQAEIEMNTSDFQALWYFLSAWGQKPRLQPRSSKKA